MTAPKLPGDGASRSAGLPEDVERALMAFASAMDHGTFAEQFAARRALRAAIRAALVQRGEVSPDAGASAAHVAPPVSASCDDVRVAVEAEREACERIIRAYREQYESGDDARLTLEQAEQDIRARGVKS